MKIAPAHKRFLAFLIDIFVYLLILAFARKIVHLPQNQSAIANIIFVAYVLVFWLLKGATIGKMALKIKIVSGSTGGNIGLWQSVVRLCGYFVSLFVFGLGLLAILGGAHRGWHDNLANTQVIEI